MAKVVEGIKNEKIKKKLLEKNKKLVEKEDRILYLSDEILHKSSALKAQKASDKSIRVANSRNATHIALYATDLKRRPPDRADDIRMYTKMDLDVWKYPQVREWFNSGADPDPTKFVYRQRPHQTGYMLRLDEAES